MTPLTSLEFLRKVWPATLLTNETLELRVIDRITKKIKRQFASSIEEFLAFAKEYRREEIYYGISTRFGKGGKKENCYRVRTAWADLDDVKLEDCKFPVKPDIVVDSGGGVHAYWLLPSPLLVKDERWAVIESINRALALRCHSDMTTIDCSRILRVPETFNHKYTPARQVRAYAL